MTRAYQETGIRKRFSQLPLHHSFAYYMSEMLGALPDAKTTMAGSSFAIVTHLGRGAPSVVLDLYEPAGAGMASCDTAVNKRG